MKIQLTDISKSFVEGGKSRMVLDRLNAEFDEGQLSIILGKSGSGKSTILNLISGIDTPDQGQILIGENNVGNMSDYERTLFRRHHIGFVFQFFNLIPTLTVLENVMLIQELDGAGTRENREKALQILDQVGLADRREATPENLSGGEQQRTAIARALTHDPSIILADEPTGNLDHETGSAVMDLMLKLSRDLGKTLIMATHSTDITNVADAVFGIQDGKMRQF
ncbi:MAG: ABC transporter ATP-binding protein [Proteobacteria bacterium]|nr:ABC transporter ATP-binding protein [Pseudomonadota bacterium]